MRENSVVYSRGVKLAAFGAFQCGPRDDFKILNKFRQYCNVQLPEHRRHLRGTHLFFLLSRGSTPPCAKALDF